MAYAERSRAWCFTHNHYTDEDKEFWKNFNCRYIIFSCETAPTTGTPHLQGYFYLENAAKFDQIKKRIPQTVAIFKANGSPEQNKRYCTKELNAETHERGELPVNGRRNDLAACRAMVRESGLWGIVDNFNCQGIRVAEKFLTYRETTRHWKPYVQWFWGPSGSGKTSEANRIFPLEDPDGDTKPIRYDKPKNSKWWDRYDGQPNVIIDDIRPSFIPFLSLIDLLDQYPCTIEYKGGHRQFLARHIIITSVEHPSTMYRTPGEDMHQLLRRIDEIREFTRSKTVDTPDTQVEVILARPEPEVTLANYLESLTIN